MKLITSLHTFIAAILCLSPITSWSQYTMPATVEQMQAVRVAPDVHVLHGMPGLPSPDNRGMIANLGFVVTDKGVVIIDSGGSSEQATILLEAIAGVTDKPVVAVFNTHIHGDHWLGNDVIARQFPDADFYGHNNMVARANDGAGEQWITLYQQLTEGQAADTHVHAPSLVSHDGDSYTFDTTRINVVHTGMAHTDNDLMIHVSNESGTDVIFLGDNSFHERMGRMDDGHFKGSIQALDKAIALQASVYVPGHGPTTNSNQSATRYRDFLQLLYSKVALLFEEGLADYEIKDAIVGDFSQWHEWSGFEQSFGRLVSLVYLEIEEDAF